MAWQSKLESPKVGAQATAVVAASFLSGAMMSLSVIAIPVFLDTNTDSTHLVRQWARLYHYGHFYMPAVSVATTGLYEYVGLRNRASHRKQWLIYTAAGAITITMVPFTWLMMGPTNDRLFRLLALASASASASAGDLGVLQGLVVRWAWLHIVRSVFPMVGAVLGLVGVLQELGQ